jgi:hypothetical protein
MNQLKVTKSASDDDSGLDGEEVRSGDETPYFALTVRLIGVPSPASN